MRSLKELLQHTIGTNSMNRDASGQHVPSNINHEELSNADKRRHKNTPWSGHLSNAEISRPGGLLLAALIRCTNERGMQLNELAKELHVTYGYINQLRNGIRAVSQISDDFALACSRFLGIPRLSVLMLAGRITPEDLFEPDDKLDKRVSKAIGFICEDTAWGHLITAELRNTSDHSQFAIVKLYEAATGKVLMDRTLQLESFAGEISRLQEHSFEQAKQSANMPSNAAK